MLDWYEEMSVGVRELDEQHRHLFTLVNGVVASVKAKGHQMPEFMTALSDIADYALYHLSIEEEYMDKYDCSFPAHLEAHRYYREKIKEFMARIETASKEGRDDIGKFAEEMALFAGHWHVEHILVMDKAYTQCFHEHGVY